MGLYRMGPPQALILALQQRLGLDEFVETGTFRGDTAAWAAEHFARVATVELSPAYCAAAQVRFRGRPNVRVRGGDSSVVLREIVPELAGPALFWLDAHWSGLDTAGREAECPLLTEIALINSAPLTHTLLVDDARLFCAPPPTPHRAEQWPDLAATVSVLCADGARHVVLCHDVFVAVPIDARTFLNDWLQNEGTTARPASRFAQWWEKLRL